MSEGAALQIAVTIWDTINGVNLRENIVPTREGADLILEKSDDHSIQRIHQRIR